VAEGWGDAFVQRFYSGVVGINEATKEGPEMVLFPNPASGDVTVQISGNWQGGELVIEDMMGRAVYLEAISSETAFPLPTGAYLVIAQNASQRSVRKLIKH